LSHFTNERLRHGQQAGVAGEVPDKDLAPWEIDEPWSFKERLPEGW
jgi:hypothetical protein